MDNRTKIAMSASIAWVAGTAAVMGMNWEQFHNLQLNEVGDFLAGAVSPLAFLWLIVGYFQQGDELKLNTEALKLQAEELRHAVNEYKALNATNIRQVNLLEKQYEEQHAKEIQQYRMILSYSTFALIATGSAGITVHLRFRNHGHDATQLEFSSKSERLQIPKSTFRFTSGKILSLELTVLGPEDVDTFISYEYTDGMGKRIRSKFSFIFKENTPQVSFFD